MEPTATNKSVLIVDDDTTLREMYEDYLKAAGFTVFTAQDGEEGLARAKEVMPSAILLDLMMPKMNGIEVLRQLKSANETNAIPVIVFTALIQDLEQRESFAAGASDYVVKTAITPRQIVEKINQFTSQPVNASPPTENTETAAAAPDSSVAPAPES